MQRIFDNGRNKNARSENRVLFYSRSLEVQKLRNLNDAGYMKAVVL
jgi:hypothetical protein